MIELFLESRAHCAESTRQWYEYMLLPFRDFLRAEGVAVEDVGPHQLWGFLNKMSRKHIPNLLMINICRPLIDDQCQLGRSLVSGRYLRFLSVWIKEGIT